MSRYGAAQHTAFGHVEACAVKTEDIPAAVASLRATFDTDKTRSRAWRLSQLEALLRLCTESREELGAALQADLHKSEFECWVTEVSLVEAECREAIAKLDEWMAVDHTNTTALNWPASSYIRPEPLGVVLVLGAWNYPVQLTLAPIVGALAAGNCMLVKPGSYSVNTSHLLCRLLHKYLDQECIKVTEGDRHLTTAILAEKWDMIFYTGSGFVGQVVAEAAAKHFTPVVLELGGKSPTIIDETADLEHAVHRIMWATFLNAGQTCVRPDFVLVHEKVADEFFKLAKATVEDFYGKDARATEYLGRIVNDKAFERLQGLVKAAEQQIVFGGNTNGDDRYVEPTVFDFGTDLTAFAAHPIMQDEIFGPLLPVCRYRLLEEAVQFVRRLPTGKPLGCYVFSRDEAAIRSFEKRISSGGMCINDAVMHVANSELPFGGVGESGLGSYHGHRSFVRFSHEKAVLRKSPVLDQLPFMKLLLSARFPPYTPFKKFLIGQFTMPIANSAINFLRVSALTCLLKFMTRFCVKLGVLAVVLRVLGFNIRVLRNS